MLGCVIGGAGRRVSLVRFLMVWLSAFFPIPAAGHQTIHQRFLFAVRYRIPCCCLGGLESLFRERSSP